MCTTPSIPRLSALTLAVTALLPLPVVGEDAPPGLPAQLTGITALQRLPVGGVQMVQAGERVLFLSDTGRYVFTGPAWDLWHGARLTSLAQAAQLAGRIDLKRLGLDPAALGALDLGTGEGEVVVFVDPRCPHCRGLMEQLPALAGRYRFRLVPLPILGSDSEAEVLRLACAAERDPTEAREALLGGTAGALPEPTGTCGQASAQRALVTAELMGIRAVPYLIAPDGRLRQGVPEDLVAWLEERP